MWEQYLPTTPTDIALVVILVLSALFALFRGFVRELLAIAAWVGAFFVTIYTFTPVLKFFQGFITNDMVAHGLTAALLFLVSLVIFSLIAHTISSWIHQTPLSSLDRFLGLIFGVIRGILIICLLYIAIVWFYAGKEMPHWVTQAKTLPLIQKGANFLTDLVPEEQRIKLLKMFQDFISDKEDEGYPRTMVPSYGVPMYKGPIIKHIEPEMPKTEVNHSFTKNKNALDDPVHSSKGHTANPEGKKPKKKEKNATYPQGYDKKSRQEMDQLVQHTD